MFDELITLALMTERTTFEVLGPGVPVPALSDASRTLFRFMGDYFADNKDAETIVWRVFAAWYKHGPGANVSAGERAMMHALIRRVAEQPEPSPDVVNVLRSAWRRAAFTELTAKALLKFKQGNDVDPVGAVTALVERYTNAESARNANLLRLCADDAAPVAGLNAPGYDWGLEDLNKSLGPLRAGYYILVAGRPEIGKTSLVSSELSFMLRNNPEMSVLWVNNEESGDRILIRHICWLLNRPGRDVLANLALAVDAAAKRGFTPERVRVLEARDLTLSEIHATIRETKPSVVVLHRIDKLPFIGGVEDNETRALSRLSRWARDLASAQKCAVIGVAQSDVKAEGRMFIDDSHVYGSKTGLPSETDAVIMLGAEDKDSATRGINIPRNKLPGGPRTEEALRHCARQVLFDRITGAYKSIAFA